MANRFGNRWLAKVATMALLALSGIAAAQTVTITAPANGSSSPVGTVINLAATTTGTGFGRVRFKQNGTNVSFGDTSAPYTDTFTPTTAGTYVFVAEAMSGGTVVATSSAVTVTVTSGGGSGGGSSGGSVSETRSYVYDQYHRVCKTINPESGATVIEYDAAGNILWSANGQNLPSTSSCDRNLVAAGAKTTRTYDAMNRVTAVSTPGAVADVSTTYYADGAVNTITAANPSSNNVVTTYSYNKRRLLTAETQVNGTTSYTLTYGYDANAHLSAIGYPDTETVTYSPDALGRATLIAGNTATYASGITYYPNGAISGFKYGPAAGGGPTHTMTANLRGLPTRSQDTKGITKILDDTYAFDANGNVTDITDQAQSGLTTRGMAYDGLDRLTVAVAPNLWGNGTYTYDALDNLRSADQGARQYRYNYDPTTFRLSNIKSPSGATLHTFGYDAQGNTTAKNSQVLVFDSANRLNQVTGSQTYRYDGQGRRVQTTDADGKTTFWLYSQAGQVLYTSEARRGQNLAYIYLGNTQVATRAKMWASPYTVTVRYQMTDALGSPVASTDTTGGNITRTTYTPWGEATPSVDGTGYTGHVMDAGTGFIYMQQRYYDPVGGRFLSNDPVSASLVTGFNFNRYWYANNNPYRFTDPDGRVAGFAKKVAEFFKDPGGQAQKLVSGLGLNANSENANNRGAAQEMAKPVEQQITQVQQQAKVVQKAAEGAAVKADKVGTVADGVAIATMRAPQVAAVAAGVGRVAHGTAMALDATPRRAAEFAVGPLAKGVKVVTGSEAAATAVEGAPVVNEAINEAAEKND